VLLRHGSPENHATEQGRLKSDLVRLTPREEQNPYFLFGDVAHGFSKEERRIDGFRVREVNLDLVAEITDLANPKGAPLLANSRQYPVCSPA
jgi:hypothetical protein